MHNIVIKFSFLLVFFVLSTNQVYAQDSDGDGIANLLDLDDDNDGILDVNDGCTDPDNMSLFGGSYNFSSGTSGTVTYNQSSIASATFTMTASSNFFTSGYNGGFVFNEGGNTTRNIDINISGNGSLYLTAFRIINILWDGSGRDRIGYFRLTLANGTVITNPATTLAKSYNGETVGLDDVVESTIGGNIFFGSNIERTRQASGFRVLTSTVINQIKSGGGIRRIQFQQVTTRNGGASAELSFIGTYRACRDLDGDGLTDNLDLDSDNDGCLDAIEGDENVTPSNLVTASGTVTVGTGSSAANQNLGTTVDGNGVPTIVNSGGSVDIGGDVGQGVGQAAIVNPTVVGGIASSNQTIVSGATPSTLTLSGHSGTIQWQSSPNNVTYTDISGANSTAYAPGALTANTYYRAVLTSAGGCTAISSTVTINIDTDGDGYTDNNDLDDDNDGILDTNEDQCDTNFDVGWLHITNNSADGIVQSNGSYVTGWNSEIINTVSNENFNAPTAYTVTQATPPTGPLEVISGINATSFSQSISLGEYVQYQFTTVSAGSWPNNPVIINQLGLASYNSGSASYSVSVSISTDNFTTNGTILADNELISNTSATFYQYEFFNLLTRYTLNPSTTYTVRVYIYNVTDGASTSFRYDDFQIGTCSQLDTDGDGIINSLDLDSDEDGCPDAIEGDENITAAQLTANRISGTVDANGVPNLVNAGGAADVGSDQGQGIGEAYNAAIQSGCLCYKPAQTTGTTLDTNHGITALGRAGAENGNWPMERKGAWTVLEAKTKGFVINRLTDAQITAIPSADLREGMMVYNITQDCLQININGTATGWKCFNTQTCPD